MKRTPLGIEISSSVITSYSIHYTKLYDFAVVATEVRKLAELSQVASKEINELTQKCVFTTKQASDNLDAIIPSVDETGTLVQET